LYYIFFIVREKQNSFYFLITCNRVRSANSVYILLCIAVSVAEMCKKCIAEIIFSINL